MCIRDSPDYMVGLRAAALYALNAVDDERASFYAVRLLVEPYASKTSGEPALTAVRVLAAQQKWLPLYQFVLGFNLEQFHTAVAAEVLSESIANLHQLPPHLLNHLLKHCYPIEDDIVMLGVIDLLMRVPPDLAVPTLRHFIHETDKILSLIHI